MKRSSGCFYKLKSTVLQVLQYAKDLIFGKLPFNSRIGYKTVTKVTELLQFRPKRLQFGYIY